MTPFILPQPAQAPRQASSAIASTRAASPADSSAAGDPFSMHLDAAAENISAKRGDKQQSKDAVKSTAAKESQSQQKPRKDGAKKSSETRKKDGSSDADASAESQTAETEESTEIPAAETDSAEQVSAEDACHQDDSLFVQAILNQQQPKKLEEPAQGSELHEEPVAKLNLQELPANPQSGPKKAEVPQAKKDAPKLEVADDSAAHDDAKPEETVTQEAPNEVPVMDQEKKPAPRAPVVHLDAKGGQKDSAPREGEAVATRQAAANAVMESSVLSQEAKPEIVPEKNSDHAPAPMPMASPQVSNQQSQAAHSAESARAAQDSPRSEQQNTFDQIVLGLRTKLDAANQKANIELNPPNLGKLHVSVELSNGILTAQFRTSTDVVRDLLSSHMDQLRSVLEGQGIAVDKLAVSAGGATAEQNPQANTNANQSNAGHDGRSGGAFSNERHASRQSSSDVFGKMWRAALDKEEPIDLLA